MDDLGKHLFETGCAINDALAPKQTGADVIPDTTLHQRLNRLEDRLERRMEFMRGGDRADYIESCDDYSAFLCLRNKCAELRLELERRASDD